MKESIWSSTTTEILAQQSSVIFDESLWFNSQHKQVVNKVKEQYFRSYGIDHIITIQAMSPQQIRDADKRSALAFTKWDVIYLNPTSHSNDDFNTLKNTIRHELGHTIPRKRKDVESYMLPTGEEIYAFDGMSVEIRLPNGQFTAFKIIEEAFCEYLAVASSTEHWESYSVWSQSYFVITQFLAKLINSKNWDRKNDLVNYYTSSDVIGSTSSILWCKAVMSDVVFLMDIFRDIRIATKQVHNQSDDLASQYIDVVMEKKLQQVRNYNPKD